MGRKGLELQVTQTLAIMPECALSAPWPVCIGGGRLVRIEQCREAGFSRGSFFIYRKCHFTMQIMKLLRCKIISQYESLIFVLWICSHKLLILLKINLCLL